MVAVPYPDPLALVHPCNCHQCGDDTESLLPDSAVTPSRSTFHRSVEPPLCVSILLSVCPVQTCHLVRESSAVPSLAVGTFTDLSL